MPTASLNSEMLGVRDMRPLSQIVNPPSSGHYHRLCVADLSALSHTVTMDTDDKNGGPNNLKAWREYRNLSQAELAEKVGTNANMISYLEAGERGLSLKWLRRLAPALDTNVGMLAQYDPNDLSADLIEIWATLSTREQGRLLEIAKLVVSDGGKKDGTHG